MTKPVAVELLAGQARGVCENQRTRVHASPRIVSVPPRGVAQLFAAAYPRFAPACRAFDEPGLAVIAVDGVTGAPAGIAYLRAAVDRHVTTVLGRHDHCELYLAGDDTLALRHVAVILSPLRSWAKGSTDVAYRLIDLRTDAGMRDETGTPLGGLRAEGPAIVRCAGYVVFALPFGDPSDWPDDPHAAWAGLPERVYLDERPRAARGSVVEPRVPPSPQRRDDRTRITQVRRTSAARDASVALVDAGEPTGRLVAGMREVLAIGERALRDGVLLGRYARCDLQPGGDEEDLSVSRVHAMLLLADDKLLLIDTGSTCGTREVGGPRAPLVELTPGTRVRLGHELTVEWRWIS